MAGEPDGVARYKTFVVIHVYAQWKEQAVTELAVESPLNQALLTYKIEQAIMANRCEGTPKIVTLSGCLIISLPLDTKPLTCLMSDLRHTSHSPLPITSSISSLHPSGSFLPIQPAGQKL